MFTIDFTKPWLYKDIIYFNQGNLSTNNTLRCKLVTGGSDDFTGGSIACRFETKDSPEINGLGKLIDAKNGIIDIVFPSNALIVGTNRLEILVNRADGGVAQSPPVMYDIWQGLTTGNGVEAETNYPILIELINSVNEASNKANTTLDRVNAMQTDVTDAIDNAYRSANEADIATSNANAKIEEVETAKTEMIKKVDASIDTMKTDVNTAKEDMKSTTDAKMQQVDNSIANMKVETTNAINNVTTKTDEKIADVDRALAAGTVDLELKKARKDANGVVHDTLEQRLESDLIVGDKSLKDFVIDMNGMKETQDLAYETNTGYKVCNDTQVGVIKDLKLSGKSLVNVTYGDLPKQGSCNFESIIATATNRELKVTKEGSCVILRNGVFKRDTEYTIIAKVKYISDIKDLSFSFYNRANNSFVISMTTIKKANNTDYATYIMKLNTWNYDVDAIVIGYHGGLTVDSILGVKDVLVLEGDYTQKPPYYFEGVASVGNGNEIEISSRKDDGNLFDINSTPDVGSNGSGMLLWSIDNDTLKATTTKAYHVNSWHYIKVSKGEQYILSVEDINGACHIYKGKASTHTVDAHVGSISNSSSVKRLIFTPDTDYVTFRATNETIVGDSFIKKPMITKGNVVKPYAEFKGDKKPILFKDTDGQWKPVTELRGIDLTACDTIEKGILTSRIGFETLVGTENIFALKVKQKTTTFTLDSNKYKLGSKCLCNKFPVVDIVKLVNEDIIGIAFSGTAQRLVMGIPNSIATTPEQLKTWLNTNNVSYLYEKTKIDAYEVNPLELESFDNITLWLILSGVIAPPSSFKITSSLPNFVKNVDTRVKRIENDFYKYTVTQNRMQLGTTYSSDRTTFRVDTATFSTEKAKQDLDYDLFRLLKHNILVGPQNYDKAEMENMMDFYVSVGKIDYNMWDELYMLIEEQHNPPVEDEAPVI